MTYIAMDVHQNHSTVAYLDPATGEIDSRKIHTCQSEISALLAELSSPATVVLEACRQAPAVCHWLEDEEVEIHLANPEKLAAIGELRPAKTDTGDARMMLDALINGYLPESYLAPKEVREDRVLSRTRQALVQIGTNLRNRLRIAFEQVGVKIPEKNICGKMAREMMPSRMARLPETVRFVVTIIWQILLGLQKQIDRLEKEIDRRVKASTVGGALTDIPGIGPIHAFTLMAELGDINRFPDHKHLHSYCGLVPKVSQSGDRSHTGHLVKRCNKHLRNAAIMAAQSAVRAKADSRAKATFKRVNSRHHYNAAKVAAARTLMTEVMYTWRQVQ
jgi:transposase